MSERACGGNLARTPGLDAYSLRWVSWDFNDHRESGPRFNVSSERRCSVWTQNKSTGMSTYKFRMSWHKTSILGQSYHSDTDDAFTTCCVVWFEVVQYNVSGPKAAAWILFYSLKNTGKKFTVSKKYEVAQPFSKSAEWFLKDHVTFGVMIAENSALPSQE